MKEKDPLQGDCPDVLWNALKRAIRAENELLLLKQKQKKKEKRKENKHLKFVLDRSDPEELIEELNKCP